MPEGRLRWTHAKPELDVGPAREKTHGRIGFEQDGLAVWPEAKVHPEKIDRHPLADAIEHLPDWLGEVALGPGEHRLQLRDQLRACGEAPPVIGGMNVPLIRGIEVSIDDAVAEEIHPVLAIKAVGAKEVDEFGREVVAETGELVLDQDRDTKPPP